MSRGENNVISTNLARIEEKRLDQCKRSQSPGYSQVSKHSLANKKDRQLGTSTYLVTGGDDQNASIVAR